MTTTTAVEVQPVTPVVGAVITGVDLRTSLDDETTRAIRQALLDHGVIFFHDQDLTRGQRRALATISGPPTPDPFGGDPEAAPVGEADLQPTKRAPSVWHSDTSYVAEPPSITALRAIELPPVGG